MLHAEVCAECGEKSGEDEKHCPFCGAVKMEFVDPGDDDQSSLNPFRVISFSFGFLFIILSIFENPLFHSVSSFLRIFFILSGIASFIWGRWLGR
jgi:hypothetical protein